jgi:hypothetical protein
MLHKEENSNSSVNRVTGYGQDNQDLIFDRGMELSPHHHI